MTSQILLDLLNHGFVSLAQINLIIFDECHHAVGDHPMRRIMKQFEACPKADQPRVLGTTATLLNSNVKTPKVLTNVRELEITFHAKVVTVQTETPVEEYGKPRECLVEYEPPTETNTIKKLNEIIKEAIDILDIVQLQSFNLNTDSSEVFQPRSKSAKIKCIFLDLQEHVKTQGLYVASKAILFHIVLLEKLKKSMDDLQSISVMIYLVTKLVLMQKIIEIEMQTTKECERIWKYSCDQVEQLYNTIYNYHKNETTEANKFCCIIFVRRRFTAKIIYHALKCLVEFDARFTFLVPEYVVGSSSDPNNSPQENMCVTKWSAQALVKFRTGAVNCLVATEVLDEGVDIPACSLVIRYDIPGDFRSYVQSKGRGRYKNSQFVIFKSKADTSFNGKYAEFRKVEESLKIELIGKTNQRIEPLPEELEGQLYYNYIEPYAFIDPAGVRRVIDEVSAISLINRYCGTLGQSKFVNCAPTYKLITSTDKSGEKIFVVSLRLPIVSPLRDLIYGDPMSSIQKAKRSVAVKVCKKLHEIGELNDHLLPKNVEDIIDDITKILPHWQEEDDDFKKKVGTVANKRYHDIFYPQPLYSAYPQAGQISYLHVIEVIPTYSCPSENRNLHFYNLLNNRAGFAILSSKKMPQLPDFPIYMNVGSLNIKLRINNSQVNLSPDELNDLKKFHWLIFKEVLNLIKNFMIYDNDNKENSFLIVPVNDKWKIDWEIVRGNKSIKKLFTPKYNQLAITDGNESHIVVDNQLSDWQLVAPNYRSATNMYIITAICDELTPKSMFPTEDYHTYTQYFWERHNLEITNMTQPLLEVKPISNKINCIKPRGNKSASKKKREDLEEHLIPELCYGIKFPALYWLKATVLPSIIYRINQLLIAEDLRCKIVIEAGLGSLNLPMEHVKLWQPSMIKEYDNEELPESLMQLDTTLEDNESPDRSTSNLALASPDIDILSLDSSRYPWSKGDEPCDLDRNIENLQLIDINYYCQFAKQIVNTTEAIIKGKYYRKGYFTKPNVTVPCLKVLTKDIKSIGPSPVDIMSALTAKAAHDLFDLERLETLGDSYLKFITSLYLFEKHPLGSEGYLTNYKGRIIGNRHLYYCGNSKNLSGRLSVDKFEAESDFVVPSYVSPRQIQNIVKLDNKAPHVFFEVTVPESEQYEGELSEQTLATFKNTIFKWPELSSSTGVEHHIGLQSVPDKMIADAVESLVGVYLESMGPIGATKLLQWFGVLPKQMKIEKILYGQPLSAKIGTGNMDVHMRWANSIQETLGYTFKDQSFLLQAFTHPSYTPNTITTSYDRLEFLGDAVIDFLITVYIYENCGELSPGALTDLRSALVNNITFACLTVRYGLHRALMAYAPCLSETIERFVKFQEERKHVVNDELLWILLEEEECNMAEYVDVPKALGDLFESVIGAIYLDCNKDLNIVWEILYALMHNEILSFSKNVPKQPVRVLFETVGAKPKFLNYIRETDTIMVPLKVQVFGKEKTFIGCGSTKRQAKAAAAKQALKLLIHYE